MELLIKHNISLWLPEIIFSLGDITVNRVSSTLLLLKLNSYLTLKHCSRDRKKCPEIVTPSFFSHKWLLRPSSQKEFPNSLLQSFGEWSLHGPKLQFKLCLHNEQFHYLNKVDLNSTVFPPQK